MKIQRLVHRQKLVTLDELSRTMTYVIIIFPFFFGVLLGMLRLPGVLKFFVDAAWAGILICMVLRGKVKIGRRIFPQMMIVVIFVVYTMFVYLFRFQSPFYYFWGARNYLRFYIAFFAVATYFTGEDAKKCLKFMDALFWINVAMCLIQFLAGNDQDNIGGIFGTDVGCNAYVIVYQTVVITRSVLEYMNGKESTARCFSRCAGALIVSAIAELKVFYLILIIIMIMAAVLTSFSMRKVLFLLVCSLLVSVAATLLGMVYSYFEGFLSIESLLAFITQKGYASDIDMGRTNAISFISKRFLTSFPAKLFGLGLGNCDTSTIGLFNTSFYTQHVDLHYSIFSYAFMFLENGYIGLTLYVGFFVLCFWKTRKILKQKQADPIFAQMGLIISLICFMLMIYNSSLRTEAGYMVYFVLALPFIRESGERIPAPIK